MIKGTHREGLSGGSVPARTPVASLKVLSWLWGFALWTSLCPGWAAIAPSITLEPRHWTAFEGDGIF